MNLGPLEIVLIVGVALLLFGGSRIAAAGKGLGEGLRNFKRGLKDDDAAPPKPLSKKVAAEDDERPL
jgi:sec-independent protein translocase protein TatA